MEGAREQRADLGAQIQAIENELAESNPQLYRHWALYLQVLRQLLPHRLEQACFHLATQWQPRRYAALEPQQRRNLDRRLHQLLQRCSSLLTVEQLTVLAVQMQREQQRRLQRRQRQLLDHLEGMEPTQGVGPSTPSLSPPVAEPPRVDSLRPPEGSVRLGLSLPLSGGLFGLDAPAVAGGSPPPPATAAAEQPRPGEGELPSPTPEGPDSDLNLELDSEGHDSGDDPDGDEDGAALVLGPLRELFEAGALDRQLPSPGARAQEGAESASPAGDAGAMGRWLEALIQAQDGSERADSDPLALPTRGFLPRQPLELERWHDALDQALARRLRNLSHALNVELLRLGLIRTLVPVSLLDGLLAGQLEGQPAPPNLMRLPLPVPGSHPAGPEASPSVLASGILLRCADLELEEPGLRTCRRRLVEHRHQVRKLGQRFRRLQQRQQVLQAERLWWSAREPSEPA